MDPNRRQQYPYPETTLATLGAYGDASGAPPLGPPPGTPPGVVDDAYDMPGQSAGAGLAWDPHLARLFEATTPIEKKWVFTFIFPEKTATMLQPIERNIETNPYPLLVTQYRYDWSGAPLSPRYTPIFVQYGSSNDVTIARDRRDERELAMIRAVWGSMGDWVFPARPRLWAPSRYIFVKALLDYATVAGGIPVPTAEIPPTRLDVILEGLECRPKGNG